MSPSPVTPETIEALWVMVLSARAQARYDRRWPFRRKGWAFEYAQDVPTLLEALEGLLAERDAERARFASLAQDHARLERELALRQ